MSNTKGKFKNKDTKPAQTEAAKSGGDNPDQKDDQGLGTNEEQIGLLNNENDDPDAAIPGQDDLGAGTEGVDPAAVEQAVSALDEIDQTRAGNENGGVEIREMMIGEPISWDEARYVFLNANCGECAFEKDGKCRRYPAETEKAGETHGSFHYSRSTEYRSVTKSKLPKMRTNEGGDDFKERYEAEKVDQFNDACGEFLPKPLIIDDVDPADVA